MTVFSIGDKVRVVRRVEEDIVAWAQEAMSWTIGMEGMIIKAGATWSRVDFVRPQAGGHESWAYGNGCLEHVDPVDAPQLQPHSAPSAKPQLKEVLVQVTLEIEGRGTVTSPAPVGPGWKLTESQKWSFGHPQVDFKSLDLVEPVWTKEYVVMSKVHKIWMLEKRFFEREPLVTAAVPEVPYAGLPLLKGLEKQQPLQGSWPNGNHVPGAVKRSQCATVTSTAQEILGIMVEGAVSATETRVAKSGMLAYCRSLLESSELDLSDSIDISTLVNTIMEKLDRLPQVHEEAEDPPSPLENLDGENTELLSLDDTRITMFAGGDWQNPCNFSAVLDGKGVLRLEEASVDYSAYAPDNPLETKDMLRILYGSKVPDKLLHRDVRGFVCPTHGNFPVTTFRSSPRGALVVPKAVACPKCGKRSPDYISLASQNRAARTEGL